MTTEVDDGYVDVVLRYCNNPQCSRKGDPEDPNMWPGTVHCPYCGGLLLDGEPTPCRKCPACSTPADYDDEYRFCTNCGLRFPWHDEADD